MARKSERGEVTVTPDPVTVGGPVTVRGERITDDGSHSVWLRWENPDAGTLFTGAPLADDGTFTAIQTIRQPGDWMLTVYSGLGGPRARILASDTFEAVA